VLGDGGIDLCLVQIFRGRVPLERRAIRFDTAPSPPGYPDRCFAGRGLELVPSNLPDTG
jgi:hypothetical protein